MKTPKIPKVNDYIRGMGKLVKIETIQPPPPPPPQKDYIFEEISAHCELRFKGEILSSFNDHNDFYGLETSVKICIENAKWEKIIKDAEEKGLGPDSEVEIVVVKETKYYRARPNVSQENPYDKSFTCFEHLEFGSRRDVPKDKEEVVWSSFDE